MIDENEDFIFDVFKKRFDISLLKLPESPPNKTPDVSFNVNGNEIVAEIKTIEDAFKIKLDKSKMQMSDDGFLEDEEFREDNTASRIARAIEKTSDQLALSPIELKSVILLNKDDANVDDFEDVLRGYIKIPKPRADAPNLINSLPQGALIARRNWKCVPNLYFWIDHAESEIYVWFGAIPTSVEGFFREKLNA